MLTTLPAVPPEVVSPDQFHVPVQDPLPQLTTARCAVELTAMVFLPLKMIFWAGYVSHLCGVDSKLSAAYGDNDSISGRANG
jgi:hypothetical protein